MGFQNLIEILVKIHIKKNHDDQCHTQKNPIRNRAPLTARSSSLRYVSAAEHHIAEQYGGTLSMTWSRYLVFENLL